MSDAIKRAYDDALQTLGLYLHGVDHSDLMKIISDFETLAEMLSHVA